MPRYFFHMPEGVGGQDPEGTELAGLPEARRTAIAFFAHSLLDHADAFWTVPDWELVVANEDGLTLFTMRAFAIDAPAQIAVTPHAGAE